nr:cationic trypsin isoform X2 [Drosophila kikkawai]
MWFFLLWLTTLCVVAKANSTDSGPSTMGNSTESSRPNSFPYIVSIGTMVTGYYKHLCVGVIISNEHLLSAAHCVKPPKPVHPGGLYVIGGSERLDGKVLEGYDIAVVKVSPKFPLNDGRFKSLSFNLKSPPDGFEGSMIGWGRVKVGEVKMLKPLPFRTIGNAKCIQSHRFVFLRNTDFCAVHLKGSQGACDGDSGAPLMDVENERLYGLMSYGRKACQPLMPYAFTRVGMFSDWIKENMLSM